jgi:integrase/recombinase XerD
MDVVVVIAEYKRYLASCGYAAKTIAGYSFYLDKFAAYLTGRRIDDLRSVNRDVIVDYRAHVMAQTLAAESKALKLRPVKRLFEHLVAAHKLLINPAEDLVETCRKHRRIGTVLTVTEVEKLLAQPNLSLRIQLRDRAIMEVFYYTAVRLNELVSLQIYDVDLTGKVLFIRKAKGRRQRVVPMGKAAGYVKEYLEKIRPRYARKIPRQRRLFLNVYGLALTAGCVQTFIRKYGIGAGIDKPVSPHTLRRTCATHMLAAGADMRYIQKLLGHRRLATTQVYTAIMPADVKQVHSRTHPNSKGASS